jgi:hypothetical protein
MMNRESFSTFESSVVATAVALHSCAVPTAADGGGIARMVRIEVEQVIGLGP